MGLRPPAAVEGDVVPAAIVREGVVPGHPPLPCRKEEAGGASAARCRGEAGDKAVCHQQHRKERAKHVAARDAYEAFLNGVEKLNNAG